MIIYVYCNVFSNYILIYISAFQTTNHIKHPWIQNLVVFFALWFSLRKIPMEIHMIQNQGPKHDPPGSRPAPRVSTVPAPALYIQHWQQSARLNCLRLGSWGEGWSLRIQRFSRSFFKHEIFFGAKLLRNFWRGRCSKLFGGICIYIYSIVFVWPTYIMKVYRHPRWHAT